MAITQIALFNASTNGGGKVIREARDSTQTSDKQIAAGFQIQDASVIQVTSEAGGGESQLLHRFQTACGEPTHTYRVDLNTSAFGEDGAAASPTMEVVANFFPASRVTSDFRAQIEREFAEFDRLCKTVAEGDSGLAYGWSENEVEHEEVKDEKARPFVILRGWQSMQHFENLTKTETFQKAIPILLGWKAPFKMWHVQHTT